MEPYLPAILKRVVDRVNVKMSERALDPFQVFFKYGIYTQVSNEVYRMSEPWPLFWLVMNFDETRGESLDIFAEVLCTVIIAMPTDKDWTMEEREENTFFPRLIPAYEEFITQLAEEKQLSTGSRNQIKHARKLWPYWAGGDVNSGAEVDNLFKKQVDAIAINQLQLKIRYDNC